MSRRQEHISNTGLAILGACLALGAAGCGPAPREPTATPSAPGTGTAHPERASARTPGPSRPPAMSPDGTAARPTTPDMGWGTPHPLTLRATAVDGRWVVACQARHDTNQDGRVDIDVGPQGQLNGDRLEMFLLSGPGPGERIDAFAGSDPSGRFVAFLREGRVFLRDTTTGTELDLSALGADSRNDASSFRDHRAVTFDPSGRQLLYLRRRREGGSRAVLRELVSGDEREIDHGEGHLWRAQFDNTGDWVVLKVITTDTNKNGHLDWRVRQEPRAAPRCVGPLPRFSVWEHPGDMPSIRVTRTEGGPIVDAPRLLLPLGPSLLERDDDGRLLLRRVPGGTSVLVERDCEARVLHADPRRELVVVACAQKQGRPKVHLVGPGYRRSLSLEVSPYGVDTWTGGAPRLVPVYASGATAIIDMERRTVELQKPGYQIVASRGPRVLLRRASRLDLWELGQPETTHVGTLANIVRFHEAGGMIAAEPWVVDLDAGTAVGRVDGSPLAISSDGRVLLPKESADARRLAVGPLRWVRPEAPH